MDFLLVEGVLIVIEHIYHDNVDFALTFILEGLSRNELKLLMCIIPCIIVIINKMLVLKNIVMIVNLIDWEHFIEPLLIFVILPFIDSIVCFFKVLWIVHLHFHHSILTIVAILVLGLLSRSLLSRSLLKSVLLMSWLVIRG